MELATYFVTTFVALFVIIDPFGVVPIFLTLTEDQVEHEREAIRRKASFIATGILLAVCLFGLAIFNFFGISIPAFQIAGGLLLLLLGIEQLSAKQSKVNEGEKAESRHREDISVFPLATPLLAGPGSISTVVLYASQAKSVLHTGAIATAIIVSMLAVYVCLRLAPLLFRVLGQTGINLMTRLMGILLTAIAVQFVLDGIKAFVG